MTATLTLNRDTFGIELRRGQFDAVVDGKQVGSIAWHETLDVPIGPGHHTLQMRHGRYSSRPHSFDAADSDTVAFQVHGANIWPLWVASFVVPSLAIYVKRVTPQ